jgi:uncharacterized membrane protein
MIDAVAVLALLATAQPSLGGGISDGDVLAIIQKHCVMCHAATPSHESFRQAPKNIALQTLAEIKKHAAAVYAQTVQTRAMPLGNETAMTDDERSTLGQWFKEQP